MTEERRNTDTQILSRLAVVESRLENNMEVLTKIVEKHDNALYGKDGNNGINTTVSKLKDHTKTVRWAVGSLFLIVAAQVAAKFF